MKKIIVIPDSFKGTMSSSEICTIMKEVIEWHMPDAKIYEIPMADGGEGSVDAFIKAMNGRKVSCKVKGPFFEEMEAFYGWVNEETAVIEMAACAGLPLVSGRENPMLTTTFGVGELMLHAIGNGATKIILGLGGSCTNDGGTGIAAALGTKFYDSEGKCFIPTGGTLSQIERIDQSDCQERLKGIEIITMCDINNPLYGKQGAAFVFAPQKGADETMVQLLDAGLIHLAKLMEGMNQGEIAYMEGAGAAGGMGAGAVFFLGAKLQMGIEVVLDVVQFDERLKDANLVLTGEGRLDIQSLCGKVVMGVAKRAKRAEVPVIAMVGDVEEGIEDIYDLGVNAILSINKVAQPFEKVKVRAKEDLRFAMSNLMKVLKIKW